MHSYGFIMISQPDKKVYDINYISIHIDNELAIRLRFFLSLDIQVSIYDYLYN